MSAKNIILKVLPGKVANEFVKKNHYSGKVVNNSQLHFGVFYNGILGGVMSYGPSTDKRKLIDLVEGTKWNEFIELNRMAFSDILPKYSESRAISISIKILRKKAPHLKRIVSFADGCQCGDGTIYRASGFDLTQIAKNKTIIDLGNGEKTTNLSITKGGTTHNKRMYANGFKKPKDYLDKMYPGWKKLDGVMLRYIKLIKPDLKKNYKILPYSKINEMGVGMYKGEKKIIGQ